MHPIATYSDDDREEFLARSKLLDHEWLEGDWVYCDDRLIIEHEAFFPALIVNVWKDGDIAVWNNHDGETDEYSDDAVVSNKKYLTWLPLEGDIMDMENWDDDWVLHGNYVLQTEFDGNVPLDGESYYGDLPIPRLLNMLRAIQRCKGVCAQVMVTHLNPSCAGIHKENEPHLCLTHWKENKK